MERLIFLAAHAVISASHENSTGIGGLEVVAIPHDGAPIFLPDSAEQLLVRQSADLRASITERLLESFDYRLSAQ
jgi:hypothetical protein